MKNATITALIISVIIGCSKSTKVTPTPGGTGVTSAFATLFPHIDTCTLRNPFGVAKISHTGAMIITGVSPYSGGSYVIQLTDTVANPYNIYAFNLLRAGVDTIISTGNGLEIKNDGGRSYYWMEIDGGNLPMDSIVRGIFIDSI